MELFGKVAIVTGSTSGIGEAIVLLFAQEGARVTVVGRNEERGKRVVEKIQKRGGESLLVIADVSKASDSKRIVEKTVERFGKIDVLVNNAGIAVLKALVDHTEEEWDRVIDTNVKGAFLACKFTIPYMLKGKGGVIINVSSVAGLVGIPERASYCASKGALISMAQQIALDYAKQGIRANALCPGTTDTPLLIWSIEQAQDREEAFKKFASGQPLGRFATSDEVVKAALFLASDRSSLMTGGVLVVDGGFIIQ